MCGIVGYMSVAQEGFKDERQHFLRHALVMDTIRGEDSTGIISVYGGRHKFDVAHARSTFPGDKYVNSKHWNKIRRNGWCTIGHNRAATLGSVKLANAHPFTFGDVTLVHNGTLNEAGQSLETFDKELEVDSMQIALALSKVEPKDADKVLSTIHGAFALAWTDKRDQSVNLARNGQRPLHFTWNSTKTFMMFMSDGNMLHVINKSLWKSNCQGTSIYEIDTHKHLKFKYGSIVPHVSTFGVYVPPKAPPKEEVITPRNPSRTPTRQGDGGEKKWMEDGRSGMSSTKNRGLPNAQVHALERYYDLSPAEELRFKPGFIFDLGNHKVMVTGEIYHPLWGNTPWPAVIHHVSKAGGEAYSGRDWKVRPVGIGRPLESKGNSPSVLCTIIDHDWAGFKYQSKTSMNTKVMGPDGKLIDRREFRLMLELGCNECHCDLAAHEVDKMGFRSVDSKMRLLCEECKWTAKH